MLTLPAIEDTPRLWGECNPGHDHEGAGMTILDVNGDLHTYLRGARETFVWKLDGRNEYDIRRPLRTGRSRRRSSTSVRSGRP